MTKGLVIKSLKDYYLTEVDYETQGLKTFGRKLALIQFSLGDKDTINYNICGFELEDYEISNYDKEVISFLKTKLNVDITDLNTYGPIIIFSSKENGDIKDISDQLITHLNLNLNLN